MLRLSCLVACVLALSSCSGPTADPDTGTPGTDAGGSDTGSAMPDTGAPMPDTGTPMPDTGMPPVDAGTDAFVSMDDAGGGSDAGSDAGTMAGCGTAAPTLPTTGTEGLVIARDGTVYYSRNGGVARIRPDGTNETNWLRIPTTGTIWGLALDATNTHLYVCDVDNDQIRDVTNLATTPTHTILAPVGSPNGITLGPDGALYVSNFSAGTVVRVDATSGTTSMVTTSAISQADGVAFTDDGHLLVTAYGQGRVYSLTLDTSHRETARAMVASMVPGADGVALDENGVMYVGGGSNVWRIGTGGTPDMTLQMGRAGTANLEWGAGVLNCHDLYVATGSGVRRISLTVGQRAVPWH